MIKKKDILAKTKHMIFVSGNQSLKDMRLLVEMFILTWFVKHAAVEPQSL